jgi:DNA mismatch repair ATPase MutS
MRTSDSLSKHQSFFKAELDRLRLIKKYITDEPKALIILDEILKGTNFSDKKEGSKLFIEKLIELNANGLIATHDVELCELEDVFKDKIKNFHFETNLKNDFDFVFDYKIKTGIVKSMNALNLMKKYELI